MDMRLFEDAVEQAQRGQRLVGVHLAKLIGVGAVYLRSHVVGVFDGVRVLVDVALTAVQVLLQRRQIVRADAGEHVGDHLGDAYLSWLPSGFPVVPLPGGRAQHHGGHVEAGALDLQRVLR